VPIDSDILRSRLRADQTLDELGPEFDVLGERYSGKVRENFTQGQQRIIIVTDRVSAFDVVLGTIPFKGQILNAMAQYWFEQTADRMPNHLLGVADPQSMTVMECEPIAVEMVVRGYLTGSTSTSIWRAYELGDRVFCGHRLPDGLRKHERLPQNIVTPSTKAPKGEHDESVAKDVLFERGIIDPETFAELETRVLDLFAFGQKKALERGLILVDTKYEIGRANDGRLVLIDEIHTPDSSRYWYADTYESSMREGKDPKALDKEYVRRWLVERGFRGDGVPPSLPGEVRVEAARRYVESYERVTGRDFVPNLEAPISRLARNLGIDRQS